MSALPQWIGTRILAILALVFLAVPVIALLIRVPWGSFGELVSNPETLQAFGLSLATAAASALLCMLLGTAIALWLSALSGVWATIVRVIVVVPLVMPPLVGGVALLAVFGRQGLLGSWLTETGVQIAFTPAAVIMAQTFVALPFMVLIVEAAQRAGGSQFARVAHNLGASPGTTLRRVTLPLLRPAIVAGSLLCFARALGEYGATALFAGSSPGLTRTVPLAIAGAFQGTALEEGAGYGLAGLLVLVAIIVVFAVGLWRAPGVSLTTRRTTGLGAGSAS